MVLSGRWFQYIYAKIVSNILINDLCDEQCRTLKRWIGLKRKFRYITVLSHCDSKFPKIGNFRKLSATFRNFRKLSETFGNFRKLLETYENFTSYRNFQSFRNLGNFRNFKVFAFQSVKKNQRMRTPFRRKETLVKCFFLTHIILSLMSLSLQFLKHRLAICAKN